jgi:hypothetical protein
MKHQRKDKEKVKYRNRNEFSHELEDRKYHQRVIKMRKKELEENLFDKETEEYLDELNIRIR